MDTELPRPASGRSYASQRRVRLGDMDATGRVRLDAISRLLQDVAIDDVEETGWGVPEHLWFVRRIQVDVLAPFLHDRSIDLVTWCSGVAALAAGRRWSVTGDRGGRVEVDSVWIHLDAEQRPTRIEGFGVYGDAAAGRRVSTKLELPDPPAGAERRPWPLRLVDIDLHGHVNNAVYWGAVEERLPAARLDPCAPLRAFLDYRQPLDPGDAVELAETASGEALELAFVTRDHGVHAVARVVPLV